MSAQNVLGADDEDAGAACLAPDTIIARSRRTVVVVAREELALVDPQLAVEEIEYPRLEEVDKRRSIR